MYVSSEFEPPPVQLVHGGHSMRRRQAAPQRAAPLRAAQLSEILVIFLPQKNGIHMYPSTSGLHIHGQRDRP